MNALQTLSTACMLTACTFLPIYANPASVIDRLGTPEKVVKDRLCKLNSIIKGAYEDEVIPYLKAFLLNGKEATEEMLGRSGMYFPVFEHYLKIHNLPEELKYLPIVESSLRPYVASSKGAVGLWQFVENTARSQGLKISCSADERRDVYKSTKAAVKYLSYLYKRFGTWELAMAAYNCGETKLSRAISQAGSVDFLVVRQFLPKETSDYVPRFLTAHYLSKYYLAHGLIPSFPDSDLINTGTIQVFENLSFNEIVQATGVEMTVLKQLNPSYFKYKLPASEQGNFLILPERAIEPINEYLEGKNSGSFTASKKSGQFKEVVWVVKPGETVEKLAALCGCRSSDILRWNNLKSKELFLRQKLIIFYPSPNVIQSRA